MAIPHAAPGELIDIRPLGPAHAESKTQTLIKTDHVEVIRLVLPTGKTIAQHKAPGPLLVQCLEGRVEFTTLGKTNELTAGQMLHLAAAEPHAVKCLSDASLLLTILRSE